MQFFFFSFLFSSSFATIFQNVIQMDYCAVVTYLYMPEYDTTEEIEIKPQAQRRKKKQSLAPELIMSGSVVYESSMRGNRLLHYMGQKYIKNNVHGSTIYWKCTRWHTGCKARAITNMTTPDTCYVKSVHNH